MTNRKFAAINAFLAEVNEPCITIGDTEIRLDLEALQEGRFGTEVPHDVKCEMCNNVMSHPLCVVRGFGNRTNPRFAVICSNCQTAYAITQPAAPSPVPAVTPSVDEIIAKAKQEALCFAADLLDKTADGLLASAAASASNAPKDSLSVVNRRPLAKEPPR